MNNTFLVLIVGILISILFLWGIVGKKMGKSPLEFFATVAPLVTALAVLFQWFDSQERRANERIAKHVASVDRLWLKVLNYMNENYDSLKELYVEMFPSECRDTVCDSPLPTIATTLTTQKEFHVAHMVAQAVEDLREYSFNADDMSVWLRIMLKWWRSPKLAKLWPDIGYAYGDTTRILVECLIREGKDMPALVTSEELERRVRLVKQAVGLN